MKAILVLTIFTLASFTVVIADNTSNCVTCHQEWEEEDGPSYKFSRDIHAQKGLGCVDCHGGDPSLEDMDEVREVQDYREPPDHSEVPLFCARCHSDAEYMRAHNPSLPIDQLSKYRTSVHGQLLFNEGDDKVANCISCHTVHEIGDGRLPHSSTHPQNLPETCGRCHADADYMAEYNISTSQLDDYRESVHGKALLERNDLGAPACNDCHSNHGAAPPEVSSLAAVCGVCHAVEAQLFAVSPHAEAYAENDFPMCETCHSNHKILKPSDAMIGSEEPALCTECHSRDDGTTALATADSVLASIKNLLQAHDRAALVLNDAKTKGMMTTDEEFLMKEVDQALIQTRTLVHAFNLDSVGPRSSEGIGKADSVHVLSAQLIDEYFFRRYGLGIATLIIAFLALMLYRKIRTMEKG